MQITTLLNIISRHHNASPFRVFLALPRSHKRTQLHELRWGEGWERRIRFFQWYHLNGSKCSDAVTTSQTTEMKENFFLATVSIRACSIGEWQTHARSTVYPNGNLFGLVLNAVWKENNSRMPNADANRYVHSFSWVFKPQTKSKYLSIKQPEFHSGYILLPSAILAFQQHHHRRRLRLWFNACVCVYAHSIVLGVCAVSMLRTDLISCLLLLSETKQTISFESSSRISKQKAVLNKAPNSTDKENIFI